MNPKPIHRGVETWIARRLALRAEWLVVMRRWALNWKLEAACGHRAQAAFALETAISARRMAREVYGRGS